MHNELQLYREIEAPALYESEDHYVLRLMGEDNERWLSVKQGEALRESILNGKVNFIKIGKDVIAAHQITELRFERGRATEESHSCNGAYDKFYNKPITDEQHQRLVKWWIASKKTIFNKDVNEDEFEKRFGKAVI